MESVSEGHHTALVVPLLVSAWVRERWVVRDAQACGALSLSIAGRQYGFVVPSLDYLKRGVRDLEKQTIAAQTAFVETTS
jgi:hypothetical protein